MIEKEGCRSGASFLSIACIVILGMLVYGHTLHVPWYFDDLPNIVENIAIRDLDQALRNLLSSGRGLTQLTFALNYRAGGLEVAGYHLVNIAVHLGTSCVVLLILQRIFRSSCRLPFFGALLFLVHPLQTQAVTYIVQRMTSLAGLFFFLGLYLYIRSREELEEGVFSWRLGLYYGAALLCGAAALLNKENAAILPFALLLFDSYFLPHQRLDSIKKQILFVLPFFIAPLWLTVQEVFLPLVQGGALSELGRPLDLAGQHHRTVLNYLVTEFSVIWLYIRLLFLPYGQVLDYGYPVVKTVLAWKNLLALAGIVALLWGAYRGRRRWPVISCGIFWFFLALSVESSVIPLDPAFEHRLYVPIFGFVLVLVGLFQLLSISRLNTLLLLLIAAFSLMTWMRNDLWTDPVALIEDNLRRTPGNERMSVALSKSYLDAGRLDDALAVLNRAVEINPEFDLAYVNISAIMLRQGNHDQALAALQKGLAANPDSEKLHNNLGLFYLTTGQSEKARYYFERVIAANPLYPDAYLNLGALYANSDQPIKAIDNYKKAIALSHENVAAHINLAALYFQQQRLPEALQELSVAKEEDPENVSALVNYAVIAKTLGDRKGAFSVLPQLKVLNRALADELEVELNKP